VILPAEFDRTFADLEITTSKKLREREANFFSNLPRSDKLISSSEAADKCLALKSTKKMSDRRTKIIAMINYRMSRKLFDYRSKFD